MKLSPEILRKDSSEISRMLYRCLCEQELTYEQIEKLITETVNVLVDGNSFSVEAVNKQIKSTSNINEKSLALIFVLKKKLTDEVRGLSGKLTIEIYSEMNRYLLEKGLKPADVKKISNDIFNIFIKGGIFSINFVNDELVKKGWDSDLADDHIMELVLAILQKEFNFEISDYAVH